MKILLSQEAVTNAEKLARDKQVSHKSFRFIHIYGHLRSIYTCCFAFLLCCCCLAFSASLRSIVHVSTIHVWTPIYHPPLPPTHTPTPTPTPTQSDNQIAVLEAQGAEVTRDERDEVIVYATSLDASDTKYHYLEDDTDVEITNGTSILLQGNKLVVVRVAGVEELFATGDFNNQEVVED